MKTGQDSQLQFPSKAIQLDEGDEGGLNLSQVLAALRRNIFMIVGVTTVVASAASIKALTDKPIYSAKFEILTQPATAESEVISSIPETLTSTEEKTTLPGIDNTTLRVLTSSKVLDPIVTDLKVQYPTLSYKEIVKNLNIATVKDTNILEVSYQSLDPNQVKTVLDSVAKAYITYSLQSKKADIQRGIEFVEAQLPDQRKRVATLQAELQQLRQQHDLIDPTSSGQQLSGQLTSFVQQRLVTQIELQQARALYIDLQNQLVLQPDESVASSVLKDSSRYQSVLDQMLEIDSQIAKDSVVFLEESPNMRILREQRQSLLPLLLQEGQQVQEELASRIRELEAQDRALFDTINSLNQQVKQLSVISRQYDDIQRELEIAIENLNQFLVKREALRIDAAQRETPWELLAAAGEPIPSSNSVPTNLILGTALGLLLGVGAALVLDRLSNVLYTASDIKEITRLPLLGVIPFNKALEELMSEPELIVSFQQNSRRSDFGGNFQSYESVVFFEAFRSLYANIRLLSSNKPLQSIVVSSAGPSEGKSIVAIYLAQAAAAMGQRVLLVDSDLRRPRLHYQLGLSNVMGLADLLSADLELEHVIQRSLLEENLFVLTAGPVPADPTRLLSYREMQGAAKTFQDTFDLVIYDVPPLVGFADAYLVADHASGILLVSGLGKLKRPLLEQALEELRLSSIPVLGIVANGAKEITTNINTSYQSHSIIDGNEQESDEEPYSSTPKAIPSLQFFKKLKRR
jgi:capsular exopolysaccharide synthesis family protein